MAHSVTDETFQSCDSPSGSSTSEPHDETQQQASFIDQSFFYKLDQLSPDNPLFFMQQQQMSPSPPVSLHSPPNFTDPLLPNTNQSESPTFWSGFNNVSSIHVYHRPLNL